MKDFTIFEKARPGDTFKSKQTFNKKSCAKIRLIFFQMQEYVVQAAYIKYLMSLVKIDAA